MRTGARKPVSRATSFARKDASSRVNSSLPPGAPIRPGAIPPHESSSASSVRQSRSRSSHRAVAATLSPPPASSSRIRSSVVAAPRSISPISAETTPEPGKRPGARRAAPMLRSMRVTGAKAAVPSRRDRASGSAATDACRAATAPSECPAATQSSPRSAANESRARIIAVIEAASDDPIR